MGEPRAYGAAEDRLTWADVDEAYRPTAIACGVIAGSGIVMMLVLIVLFSIDVYWVTFTSPALLWSLPLFGVPFVVGGHYLGRTMRQRQMAGTSSWPGKPKDHRLAVLHNAAINEVAMTTVPFVFGFAGSIMAGNLGPFLLSLLIGGVGMWWAFPRKAAWGEAVGAGDIGHMVAEG